MKYKETSIKQKIGSFRDLIAWQKGHLLVIAIYKLVNGFPSKETFNLTSQMSRAAVSITSNIAEGFARQGNKEKTQFYFISLGSLTELQNQLLIAKDLGYIQLIQFEDIYSQTILVHKLTYGLIKSLRIQTKYEE